MTPSALHGVHVLELGGDVATAYATRLLADLGADTVKIEPPQGDTLRERARRASTQEDAAIARGLFEYLNANKHSVVIDPEAADSRERLRHHFRWADIVIERLGPGGLEELGLDRDTREELRPSAVVVRLSDWGLTGPNPNQPATPLTVQAAAGWITSRGDPQGPSVQVGGQMDQYVVGCYASTAALTGRAAAQRSGVGGEIDLSVMECLHSTVPYTRLFMDVLVEMGWGGNPGDQRTPFGVRPCKDGWVGINILTGQQWVDACTATGLADYTEFQHALMQGEIALEPFSDRLKEWLADRTVNEVVELCQAFRIPAVPIGSADRFGQFEQWQEREFFLEVEGDDGVLQRPGFPWRLSATPAKRPERSPRLGEHTDIHSDTVSSPGTAPGQMVAAEVGPQPDRPLDGLRVVDLGSFWAAPYLSCYLGAMGADVTKIESTKRPDGFRFTATFPQLGDRWYERSLLWQATNLNKRDVTLDLGSDDGRDLLRRLCADGDVFIENYAARVVEQFGFGYEQLREINPRMIVLRLPGFGLEGPWRDYVGWGNAFEQLAGLSWVTGFQDGPPLTPGGYIDPTVGMHAATALLAALEHRERTGEGQLIEIPQIEVGACLTAEQVIAHSLTGQVLGRRGNRSPDCAPQGVYRCRDEDGEKRWVAISVRDSEEFDALRKLMGEPPALATSGLETLEGRREHHDELDQSIETWTADRTADEVVAALEENAIPVAAVLRTADHYEEPRLAARHYYQEIEHPIVGARGFPGYPMRFWFMPHSPHLTPAPLLGQHNDEVLGNELGLTSEELLRLEASGVIGTEPVGLGES